MDVGRVLKAAVSCPIYVDALAKSLTPITYACRDYIAKLVAIGDSGCGKSSLTVRLCEGRFSSTHDVTIGVEFGSRIVPVGPPANKALEIGNTAAAAALAQHSDGEQKKMKLSLW
jgi:Ras-related protein Rab-2A